MEATPPCPSAAAPAAPRKKRLRKKRRGCRRMPPPEAAGPVRRYSVETLREGLKLVFGEKGVTPAQDVQQGHVRLLRAHGMSRRLPSCTHGILACSLRASGVHDVRSVSLV